MSYFYIVNSQVKSQHIVFVYPKWVDQLQSNAKEAKENNKPLKDYYKAEETANTIADQLKVPRLCSHTAYSFFPTSLFLLFPPSLNSALFLFFFHAAQILLIISYFYIYFSLSISRYVCLYTFRTFYIILVLFFKTSLRTPIQILPPHDLPFPL